MTGKHGTPIERFERHYIPEPNSGCWLWIGSTNLGYGYMNMPGNVPIRAHVFSYKFYKGKVAKELDVRHTCDVRCCVNPDHLLVGTRKQNMQDAKQRGRTANGFKLPQTKLSTAQVTAIKNDRRKQNIVAREYHVTPSYICMLKKAKRRAT